MVYKWFSAICPACDRARSVSDDIICQYCLDYLPRITETCYRCALPMPAQSVINRQSALLTCGNCLANNPPQYRSVSAFIYEFPIPEMIGEIKFRNRHILVRGLSEQFANAVQHQYQDDVLPEYIIPVPLHPLREFQRGFNQSLLFSKQIASSLKLEIDTASIRRIRHTKSQMSMNLKHRQENMKNAFELVQELRYRHVAIFDDVMTTGATMQAIARILLKSNVNRVDLWSLARTPK